MAMSVEGTWRLKVWETRTADGQVGHPLGRTPVGYLSYTPDGYVFVTMMVPDRELFQTRDLLGGTAEERARAAAGFVAYCGRYELQGRRVLHHIEVSLFPNWVGTALERFVEVDGDILTLSSSPQEIGGLTTSHVVWERAKG